MHNFFNTNRELINILSENTKDPFLILDQGGNILSYNNEASYLFSLEKTGNFYALLDQNSAEKLDELCSKLFIKKSKIDEVLDLKLSNGKKLKIKLTINSLINNDEILLFLVIKPLDSKVIINEKTSLQIKLNELDKIINNTEVLNVIDEIKSNYPFTFISKNKVRTSADKLKEFFWIKSVNGTYVLVNSRVSAFIGLNASQIEGKPESNFIPPYLVNFQKSIDQYIIESANCIILDGLCFSGLNNPEEYETIEIPLFNSENELIAIIGISRKKLIEKEFPEIDSIIKDLLEQIPHACLFIDHKNLIKYFNNEFVSLYGSKFIDITKTEYFKFFPLKICEKISGFIKSSSDEDSFEIEEDDKNLNFRLTKIFKENSYIGASITIEEKFAVNEKDNNLN